MRLTKVIGIILIITLGMGVFGGCQSINKEAAKEQAAEVIQISEDDKGDGGSKMPKKAERIEDLYYYKENYSPFAEEGDKKALLSIGEEEKTYKVGEGIEEGEYIGVCNSRSYSGSLKVTEDGNAESDEYMHWDMFDIITVFKVKNGEYISAKCLNIYPLDGTFGIPMEGDAYLPGMYKVGTQLPAGEYITIGKSISGNIYSEPSIGSGQEARYIFGDQCEIFTVTEGQYLRISECMLYPIDKVPSLIKEQKAFDQGMYKVGVTIPSGTYMARTTQELGQVTIYKDSLDSDESMVSMIYVEPEVSVTLQDGQYVRIQYAELTQSFGTSNSFKSTVQKGPDIVFDKEAKPILTASRSKETHYKAGQDIQPGEYMAIADDRSIYIEINNEAGDILFNGGSNCMIFNLKEGESLTLRSCKVYDINNVPYVPKKGAGYLTGMYKIGTHIPAGEYLAVGATIYLDVYEDNSWEWDAQIGDLTISNYGIITLEEGQYFELAGEAALYPIDMAPAVEPKEGVFTTGMYKAGTHIPAGTYECSAVGTDGYVVISKDSKNNDSSEISTTKIRGKEKITITEGQYIAVYGAALVLKEKKAKNEVL